MSSLAMYDPATWERVRDDYLCGMTAAEVCRRHGVSRSQFYAQARAGGWRRADQAAGAEALDTDAHASPTHVMAGDALRRAAAALALGRLGEARGWTRLAADLRALAVEEIDDSAWALGQRRFAVIDAEDAAAVAATGVRQTALPDATGLGSPAAPPLQTSVTQGFGAPATDRPASPAVIGESGREPPCTAEELAALQAYAARMRAVGPGDPAWEQAQEALAACAELEAELSGLGLEAPPDG